MGYIEQLEIELSSVQNGFKEEEKRALYDISICDLADAEKLAFAAYGSEVYQVRMYAVFLYGHMSDSKDILSFMRDKVSADPNWRVHYVRKSVGNALRDINKKYPNLIKAEISTWNLDKRETFQVYKLASRYIYETEGKEI